MFSFMEAQGENEDEENGDSNKIETDSSRIEQDVVNEADSQQNPSELQIGNVKMRDKMGKIKVKEGALGHRVASQVTIINEEWKNTCFPHIATRSLSELLDEGETLIGRAANQTDIPFSGWVELKFQLGPKRGAQAELLVPVLLSSEQGVGQPPIIGYNVIQQLVTKGMEQYPDIIPEVVKEAFSCDCKKAVVLIRMMQKGDQVGKEGIVKVGRINTVVAAGQTKTVKCRVRAGPLVSKQEVLFEPEVIPQWPEGLDVTKRGNLTKVHIPVTNISNVDIMLAPRTVLGRVQQVRSIYPADTKPATVKADWNDIGEDVLAAGVMVAEGKDMIIREVKDLNEIDNTGQDTNGKLWDCSVYTPTYKYY
ncbi:hypothetical protein PO909_000938 [Leuciscus waleckii]